MSRLSIEGWRFGSMVVGKCAGVCNSRTVWNVVCDCGAEFIIEGRRLTRKHTARSPPKCPHCAPRTMRKSNIDRTKLHTVDDLINAMREKSERDPVSGCVNWTGATYKGGYGRQQSLRRKVEAAHRLAYEIHIGSIPEDMRVLHKCDNPRCINPDHLFVGTQHENMLDKVAKGRQRNKQTGKLQVNM